MGETELAQRVEAVRRFNRFYTRQIGVLNEGLLQSQFSLAEARVIYELAHRELTTAAELSAELGLDPGYLSRILRGFKKIGLLATQPSPSDRRRTMLQLTEHGQQAFAMLNGRSRQELETLLGRFAPDVQERLVAAMGVVEQLLGAQPERSAPYILRPHQPGDMGWVVRRHGMLYAEEFGFDEHFEALVASIVAAFVEHFDPKRERCWIAERHGQNVGSVFVVRVSDQVAKLRLLLVEPSARGLGIGRRLVDECIRFARQAGYAKMTLWTQSNLLAARGIYQQAGFRMVEQGPHHSFGQDLIEEVWELEL